MIGKTLLDYIEIHFAIAAFRLVAPLSIAYLALSLAQRRVLVSPWLAAYAALEAAFYLLVYLPRHYRLQKPAAHPPPLDFAARQALFHRCQAHLVGSAYPTGWFTRPDFTRADVVRWTLWALFSAEAAEPEWEEEIEGYVCAIEALLGRTLERERGGDGEDGGGALAREAASMRLTFDPVQTLHRPFVWYMIVGAVDTFSSLSLLAAGFTHYATPKWFAAFPFRPLTVFSQRSTAGAEELSYAYRPHRSATKLPIVFLHGIGIGTWPYLPFFTDLIAQDPDVGILIIEVLPISMHITRPPLPRAAFLAALTKILDSLSPAPAPSASPTSPTSTQDPSTNGTAPPAPAAPAPRGFARFVLAAHSYGTVQSAWLLHHPALRARAAAALLVDPIPFLLHLPAVARNFVYRRPVEANEWQLWYFASRDADVSRALGRHFFWAENVLWKEELMGVGVGDGEGEGKEGEGRGMRTGVVLSGEDQIVHAEEVRKYLTGCAVPAARWVSPAPAAPTIDAKEGDGKEGDGKAGEGQMEVLFYPGLDHAMVFDTRARRAAVVEMLGRFVRLE